ncbi:response regulator [Aromatoleum evansii]|uniref:response regulator n=1 Tax=Aromatoleum evansii TaxID=59406 RepID=UPI00145E8C23|nr:response regulator transcription factor [Aromatoleum evansii]NMG31621.1 response regulator [Aromatoleum evansii]
MDLPIRTLFADDSPEFRRVLHGFIALQPGIEIVGEAGDGLEALCLVDSLKPDLLVVDLMMPGASGMEVAMRLARRPVRPKVIVVSMHAADDYRAAVLACGADAFVTKGSIVSELPCVIGRLFAAGGRQ